MKLFTLLIASSLFVGCAKAEPSVVAVHDDLAPETSANASNLTVGCAPGSIEHDDPGFCIALPDGWAENRASSVGNFHFAFESPQKIGLSVWMTEGDTIERRLRWYEGVAKIEGLASRSVDIVPGLEGKKLEWEEAGSGMEHHLVLVQGKTHLAYCETRFPKAEPHPEAVAACLTLRPIGDAPPGSIATARMLGPFATTDEYCRAECRGLDDCTCTPGLHRTTSVAPFAEAQLVEVTSPSDGPAWHLAITTSDRRIWVSHRGLVVWERMASAGMRQKQRMDRWAIDATSTSTGDDVVFHPRIEVQQCDFGSNYTGCTKEGDTDGAIVCGFPSDAVVPRCVVLDEQAIGLPEREIVVGGEVSVTTSDGASKKTELVAFH